MSDVKHTDKRTETHACVCENTEKHGDLISRKAAIDAIDHYLGEVKNIPMGTAFKEGVKDGYCRIRSIIKSLPSAELERKQGKWIYNSPVTMKCNQCGLVIKDWDWHRFNYCPNCGSYNGGEQE